VSWTDLGEVASLTYPQITGIGPAHTVCSSYANGWLVGVTDVGAGICPGGTSLASLSYHPNGMTWQVSHGNAVTDTYAKDPYDMGRPYRISTSNALSNWDSGSFEYDGAGNIKALRGTVEPVARPAPTHKDYTYDAFGNLTRVTTDDTTYQDLPTSLSTNRLTGSGYDASGNLTAWGGYGYGYDALNAMTTLTGGTLNKAYGYDADGERLSFKDVPSNTTTFTLRGLDGKVLREYTYNGSTWSWSKDIVYGNGQLLAAIDSSGTRHFTLDHLGSPRLITKADRSVSTYHAYWAYGTEADTAGDSERMKFTGHERDLQGTTATTDDLDYMHARYYNPTIGRFLRVDPVRGNAKNPQSWNLYSYVTNNPVNRIDPTGTYQEDVHLDLTTVLAFAVGFNYQTAAAIGMADQGVDEDPATYSNAPGGEDTRAAYHFTSESRRVELWEAFEASGSTKDLGTFLHAQQDSYSHAGFGPKAGHAAAGTAPDKTYNNAAKANLMAAGTYGKLAAAAAKLGISPANKVEWERIKALVSAFNATKTRQEKARILDQMKRTIIEERRARLN